MYENNLKRREHDNDFLHFDKTVNLGNILTMIILLLTIFGYATRMERRMTSLEVKMDRVWLTIK